VRELRDPSGAFYVKVYEYHTWRSRLRDLARRTAPWSRSRAAAEFDALTWMRQHGLPAPEPLLAAEQRRLGFLVRAVLVTTAFPGEPVDAWLERLQPVEQTALVRAVGALVGRLHELGFRDRNLDLRNLLARRRPDGAWEVVKIDSPRHCLRRPGRRMDALARADWTRLLPQLGRHGLADIARDTAACANPAQSPAGQRSASSPTAPGGSGPSSSAMTSNR
jgi:hypothetical protein